MDIATLGFSINAQPLDKGAQALDRIAVSGEKAASAERSQTTASQGVARSATAAATSLGVAETAMRSSAAASVVLGNSNRAAAAHTANLTAQLNDIGVMLAAGQNPFQLAMQQGTQVNQVFAQMGGGAAALRGIGTALVSMVNPLSIATLGIIALGGYGVKALMGLREEAVRLEDRIDGVAAALDRQTTAAKTAALSSDELRQKYGNFADVMQSTLDLLATTATAEAQRQIDNLSQSLSDLLGVAGSGESRAALASFFDVNIGLAFTDATRAARAEARGLTAEFQNAQAALAASNGNLDQQITATRSMLENATALANASGSVNSEEAELIVQLSDALDLMVQQKEATTDIASSAIEVYEGFRAVRDARERANQSAQDMLDKLNAEVDLQATIATYGRDSAEVAALRADQERAVFEATLDTLDATDAMKAEIRLAYIVAQDLAGAADSVNFSGAISSAQTLANTLGIALSKALALSATTPMMSDEDLAMSQTVIGGAEQRQQTREAVANFERITAAASKTASAIGGSGGGRSSGGGGLAGATRAATDAAKEQERAVQAVTRMLEDYDRQVADTARKNAELASSWASTFTDAAIAGDLSSAFTRLGSDSRSAFFDALGSGQSIGSIFSGGLSGVTSGLAAGGLSGIGSALSSAMPIIGAVSTIASLIGSFSSSKLIGQGVSGQIGGGLSGASEYSTKKKSTFWGLFSSTSTSSNPNDDLSAMLGASANIVRQQISDLADGIGGTAKDLTRVVQKFDIDTQGMDAAGVQQALSQEITAYQERVAAAVLGTSKFSQMGETATATLERLTGSLSAYNDVQRVLGMEILPKSIANAAHAARVLQEAGGAQAVGAGASSYFSGIMSADEQARSLNFQVNAALTRAGIDKKRIKDEASFQAEYERLMAQGQNVRAAELLTITPSFLALERLRDARTAEAAAMREAELAAKRAAQAADLQLRQGLQQEIWQLTGNIAAQREFEMRGLTGTALAMQKRVYALEDQAKASEKATQALNEMNSALANTQFTSLYAERRATLDAQAGRGFQTSYTAPSFGASQTKNQQGEVVALLRKLLEQAEITSSASMNTSAATQRTEQGIQIVVAQGAVV